MPTKHEIVLILLFHRFQNNRMLRKRLTATFFSFGKSKLFFAIKCKFIFTVLGKISIRLGKSNYNYLELETTLKDNELLNKLHWDPLTKQYSDYGLHSHEVKLGFERNKKLLEVLR